MLLFFSREGRSINTLDVKRTGITLLDSMERLRWALLEKVRHVRLAVDTKEVEPSRKVSHAIHHVRISTYQSSTFKLMGTIGLGRPPELWLHASSWALFCCWFCAIISICCCQAWVLLCSYPVAMPTLDCEFCIGCWLPAAWDCDCCCCMEMFCGWLNAGSTRLWFCMGDICGKLTCVSAGNSWSGWKFCHTSWLMFGVSRVTKKRSGGVPG